MNLGLLEWAVPRQLRTRDVLGRGAGARAARTDAVLPRTYAADEVVPSVCPYCAVGCGQHVYVKDGAVVQVEGDPESPVSRGHLCARGAATLELTTGATRARRCLYRPAYSQEWQTIDLDTALDMVAERVLRTRAETWQWEEGGTRVRRTTGIAALLGPTLDAEEHYLAEKLLTALGVVHVESRDPVWRATSTSGLRASFGRGGSTGCLRDLQHADTIVIAGSNLAETHPVAFQWVMEAKARGATVVHVDPRFTRTSAHADIYVPLRAGSDLALVGGLVHDVLSTDGWFEAYVRAFTNAATLVRADFADAEDLDGIFSGLDEQTRRYDPSTWRYEEGEGGALRRDESLAHPRCVLNVLRRHFARYTPDIVERVCGIAPPLFAQLCAALRHGSGPERTTAIVYGGGWTEHGDGQQIVRAASVLQLLLGNVGRPGGGVHAVAGGVATGVTASSPRDVEDPDSQARSVSMRKAYWGPTASAANAYCADYLPRADEGPATPAGAFVGTSDARRAGRTGALVFGANPVLDAANSRLQRNALAELGWLVVRDLALTESALWWKEGPDIESGTRRTAEIPTEVFFFPSAAHTERDGTLANADRLLQWHAKAADPPGDARSDLWFAYHLGRKIREKLAGSTDERDRPVGDLTWAYPLDGPGGAPKAEAVLAEMNGWGANGRPLSTPGQLRDDGSTSSGRWLYCGVYATGTNRAARRQPGSAQNWLAHGWGWSWPSDRRIQYNRASARPDGGPWSERKALVWWDRSRARWAGHDLADVPEDRSPDYLPPEGASGEHARSGCDAFVAQPDGKGWLYAPSMLEDGPLPVHYEPQESPIDNALYTQRRDPVRGVLGGGANPYHPSGGEPGADVFPCVLATCRLAEHGAAITAPRTVAHLAELQPSLFVEVSPELAAERGLEHGGWATLVTARGSIEARVLVTDRIAVLRAGGTIVHQIGLPSPTGDGHGDWANELTSIVVDPNTHVSEVTALTADIRPGRRPRGRDRIELVDAARRRAGVSEETGMGVRP